MLGRSCPESLRELLPGSDASGNLSTQVSGRGGPGDHLDQDGHGTGVEVVAEYVGGRVDEEVASSIRTGTASPHSQSATRAAARCRPPVRR